MCPVDKDLTQVVLRGTLLHRIWGLWLSPPFHCAAESSEHMKKGHGVGGKGREHRAGTFCGGQKYSRERMRSSGGQAESSLSLPSTEKLALGGSDL
jgi:hypothetical protein